MIKAHTCYSLLIVSVFAIGLPLMEARAQTTREVRTRTSLSERKQRRLMRGKRETETKAEEAAPIQSQEEVIAASKAFVRARQTDYERLQKQIKKPQYSDPSYFGHKRKPRIRKKNRRKFCKECGIRH